jgi:hypothetical protein
MKLLDILSPLLTTLHDVVHARTHRLLFCRERVLGVDNEWANLDDIASVQALNLLSVQPGSMEAMDNNPGVVILDFLLLPPLDF